MRISQKRIFLYGSCVARDTLEFLSPDEFRLAGYVARQSLISMGRDALGRWPGDFALRSAFQNRMVRSDWAGDAWSQIVEAARGGLDALVLDFTDERFGVFRYQVREVVTRSIDMMGTPLEGATEGAEFWDFGSAMHLRAWSFVVESFAGRLRELGLLEKAVVLRVPWASVTEEGRAVAGPLGLDPVRANDLYVPYYEAAVRAGFRMIDLSDFPVFAEPLHQWGLAPYHYTIEVYEEIARQLRVFWG